MTEVTTKPAPFTLTTAPSAAELAPAVPAENLTKQRLNAAFAQVARLDQSIANAKMRHLSSRTNGIQRWIIRSERRSALTGAALATAGALAVIGGVAACIGAHLSVGDWTAFTIGSAIFAGVPGGIAGGITADALGDRQVRSGNPLSSGDLSPTLGLLRSMPHTDQALVIAYLDSWRADQTASGRLTSAASEALMEAATVDPKEYGAELRTARAASLTKEFATVHNEATLEVWRDKLSGLLSECPLEERRELAGALIERLFPNEKCAATNLGASKADDVYRLLRSNQKERS